MELFKEVAQLLIDEKPLPKKYKPHKPNPYSSGRWDCHIIKGNWVLLYRFDYANNKIIFEVTGTHFDLYKE